MVEAHGKERALNCSPAFTYLGGTNDPQTSLHSFSCRRDPDGRVGKSPALPHARLRNAVCAYDEVGLRQVTSIGNSGTSFALEVEGSSKETMEFVVGKNTQVQGQVKVGTLVAVDYQPTASGQNLALNIKVRS
jgi:hypothetical protein